MCLVALSSLSSALVSGGDQYLPPDLKEIFADGVGALKAGRLEVAERAFQRILSQGGRIAYVHNNLGVVYQRRGDHRKAITQFREAIRLDPQYPAPRALIGASLLTLGELTEATRHLELAAKLQPMEPLTRIQLAKAYERAGNFQGVVDQYRALCDISPGETEYAYRLGLAYKKLSEWSIKEIMRISPRSARLYQTLGQHYLIQGKPDSALRAFQEAADIDPTLPEIHLALAYIHLESGNEAQALREVEHELRIVPESRSAQELKRKLSTSRPR